MNTIKRLARWIWDMCDVFPVPPFDVDTYIKDLSTRPPL